MIAILLAFLYAGLLGVLLANVAYLRRNAGQPPTPDRPRVSVLIPARNEEKNLKRLLPSLLEQGYPSFEVILYDDGSEDGTWEAAQSFSDKRLKIIRGSGPPPGWVGKVHALYQATREAGGDLYLFVDADARFEGPDALQRLVDKFTALPSGSVLTGLTRLQGEGMLLVSLVPFVILSWLPWPLAKRSRMEALGALNGQCWMIPAEAYHRMEPHKRLPDAVLEDVMIGRLLMGNGLLPTLVDVQDEVSIFMYNSFKDAWNGFRKNAYLIMGGQVYTFVPLFVFYIVSFALAPFFSAWLLLALYILKRATDRIAGFPIWISLLAPVSFLLGAVLQLHSAVSHWTGRVTWKGRRV